MPLNIINYRAYLITFQIRHQGRQCLNIRSTSNSTDLSITLNILITKTCSEYWFYSSAFEPSFGHPGLISWMKFRLVHERMTSFCDCAHTFSIFIHDRIFWHASFNVVYLYKKLRMCKFGFFIQLYTVQHVFNLAIRTPADMISFIIFSIEFLLSGCYACVKSDRVWFRTVGKSAHDHRIEVLMMVCQ